MTPQKTPQNTDSDIDVHYIYGARNNEGTGFIPHSDEVLEAIPDKDYFPSLQAAKNAYRNNDQDRYSAEGKALVDFYKIQTVEDSLEHRIVGFWHVEAEPIPPPEELAFQE